MKKLFGIVPFIFFFLALPVSAEEAGLFLTNQSSDKTTQFQIGDEIHIEGICLPANQDVYKIFVIRDKTWQIGDKLSDVSGGIETLTASADGSVPRTQIWKIPNQTVYEGMYDIIIDTNNNYTLEDYERQCVIGITDAGFRVGAPPPPPPPVVETPPTPPPPPPVVSEPEPTPPPPPAEPSTAFSLDQYVVAKSLSNIRKSAGGKLVGTQIKGALGVVVGGPVRASIGGSDYWFWNINFENDPDGWVSESMIKNAPAPKPEPAPVEEAAVNESIVEPLANNETTATGTATTTIEETPKEEITSGGLLAQVSDANKDIDLKPFMDSIILGGLIFLGLILGSVIVAEAIKRKN